ncbi:hypothetical protein FUAX_18010 [Fulvitalea axinellae]|uniref:Auto-transporter adhesin head GIN domain-containing protein n=1 Tax=Fulvitalea axinellae TaxID=1182444 RepID=A0AAU9CSE9_9BACT|nr:hypothetical protein FUAX_18010 [Fulvitalea axinellae]
MKSLILAIALLLTLTAQGLCEGLQKDAVVQAVEQQVLDKSDFHGKTIAVSLSKETGTMTVTVKPDSVQKSEDTHTLINLKKIDDLDYKTRVIRYFGGLLKEDVYGIKKLTVQAGEKVITSAFTRSNLSAVVKLFY